MRPSWHAIGSDRLWPLVQDSSTTITVEMLPRVNRLRRYLVDEVELKEFDRAIMYLRISVSRHLAREHVADVPRWDAIITCRASLTGVLPSSETCVQPEEGMEMSECSKVSDLPSSDECARD